MFFWIFLCSVSIKSGTAIIAVGCVVCMSLTMCLSPWQTTTEAPIAIGYRKPIVDSYV